MKKSIMIILIYLIGSFFAYKYTKFNMQIDRPQIEWTIGNRNFALLMCSGSWCTVIAMGVINVIKNSSLNNEKANW